MKDAHMPASLNGKVAVVAGATRGAGRGIARALGEAGTIVYCTGRSVAGSPSAYGRPETIDQTASLINDAGGRAIAVRVDHGVESEVKALFDRVQTETGRVDLLVNSIAGEDPLLHQFAPIWTSDLTRGEEVFRQCVLSHMITAKHAAALMVRAKSGLIVEVTEGDTLWAGTNPLSQTVKLALKGLALNMAAELKPHGVAAVAVTPGFLRSESMLERMGVTEANWQQAGKEDSNFLESESPLFIGRAVACLAADPNVLAKTGQLLTSWDLAREFNFADVDGGRPDWGAHPVDWSGLPPDFVDYFKTGAGLQRQWLDRLLHRTETFIEKLPR
jgi:NAD(P)-dependent dehydrogenase (short-subunit alcohol dehydrogenase family)